MASLAGAVPENGKVQIMQLVALRHPADHPDKLKQADRYPAHRKLLEEIAAGKRAHDPQGFAKEYAAIVLARLDGNTLPPPDVPRLQTARLVPPGDAGRPGDLPAALAVVRGCPFPPPSCSSSCRQRCARRCSPTLSGPATSASTALPWRSPRTRRIQTGARSVRVTGKGNPVVLDPPSGKRSSAWRKRSTRSTPAARRLPCCAGPDHPPVMLFVDPTDMLWAGSCRPMSAHEDLIDEVLAVRAGKQPNVTGGLLKARLQKVPRGPWPAWWATCRRRMRKEAGTDLQNVPLAVPTRIDAHIEKLPAGFDVSVTAGMIGADDARNAVMQIGKMRKEGIDMLQQLLKQPDANPRLPAGAPINLLQSLQMENDGAELRLRAWCRAMFWRDCRR